MAKNKKDNYNIPEENIPGTEENINDAEETSAEAAQVNEPEENAAEADDRDEKLAALEAELRVEKDRYLRLAAEYDNFRKRSMKEREALYSDVRSDTILKLLPVYDNLARALSHETSDEAFKKGVEMTMTQLQQILEKMGVTPIEALGKKFDPTLHNAVMHVEDEKYGAGEIIEEYEKGFKMGDKVIRFSTVVVAN